MSFRHISLAGLGREVSRTSRAAVAGRVVAVAGRVVAVDARRGEAHAAAGDSGAIPSAEVMFSTHYGNYRIDWSKMEQINLTTMNRRGIRRYVYCESLTSNG